jgi:hypothetical protein
MKQSPKYFYFFQNFFVLETPGIFYQEFISEPDTRCRKPAVMPALAQSRRAVTGCRVCPSPQAPYIRPVPRRFPPVHRYPGPSCHRLPPHGQAGPALFFLERPGTLTPVTGGADIFIQPDSLCYLSGQPEYSVFFNANGY